MEKRTVLIVLIFLIMINSGCQKIQNSPSDQIVLQEQAVEQCIPKIVPSLINVQFKDNYNVETLKNANLLVNQIESISDITPPESIEKTFITLKNKNYQIQKDVGLDRWVTITLAEDANLEDELNKWKSMPEVEQAELVYEPCLLLTPNDPWLYLLWHHNNTGPGQFPDYEGVPWDAIPDADIDSIEAWDITTGNITIGNPDTALDWLHEDLIDNIWQNLGEDFDNDGHTIEWNSTLNNYTLDSGDINGIDNDANGYKDDLIGWDFSNSDNNPMPTADLDGYQGHGTTTSGVAVAKGNNSKGIVGVCWNCKVIASRGVYNYKAIQYAVDNGAKVLTISWAPSYSGNYKTVFDYAHEVGVVIVAAAGNCNLCDGITCGCTIINPVCNSENIICVSGTNQLDRLWYSAPTDASSYGIKVDIGAPASMFVTTASYTGAKYKYRSGTSLSSPLVAGIAALILIKNPDLSPDEVKSIIKSSVDRLNQTNKYLGTGRVNAYNALQLTLDSLATNSHFPIAIINSNNSYYQNNNLNLIGIANSTNFSNYKIWYGTGDYPIKWVQLNQSNYPVKNNLLYSINLSKIPYGMGQIKLTTTDGYNKTAYDTFPYNNTVSCNSDTNCTDIIVNESLYCQHNILYQNQSIIDNSCLSGFCQKNSDFTLINLVENCSLISRICLEDTCVFDDNITFCNNDENCVDTIKIESLYCQDNILYQNQSITYYSCLDGFCQNNINSTLTNLVENCSLNSYVCLNKTCVPNIINQSILLSPGLNIVAIKVINSSITSQLFNSKLIISYEMNSWRITNNSGVIQMEPFKGYFIYSTNEQIINLTGNRTSEDYIPTLSENNWNLFILNSARSYSLAYPTTIVSQTSSLYETDGKTFTKITDFNQNLNPNKFYWVNLGSPELSPPKVIL